MVIDKFLLLLLRRVVTTAPAVDSQTSGVYNLVNLKAIITCIGPDTNSNWHVQTVDADFIAMT
jgi:hypothetical protein